MYLSAFFLNLTTIPYVIAVYKKDQRTGAVVLIDIMKAVTYENLQDCKDEVENLYKQDKADYDAAVDEYVKNLESFLMDQDLVDTTPVAPCKQPYTYVPEFYTDNALKNMP